MIIIAYDGVVIEFRDDSGESVAALLVALRSVEWREVSRIE